MNNNFYNKYFDDLINLYPSINENLNLPQYKHLNNILENSFSLHHRNRQRMFSKHYYNLLNNKSKKTIYDKVILYDCKTTLEYLQSDLLYLPINHQENSIIFIMEISSDDSILTFKTNKDYLNVLEKFKTLDCICNSVIELMNTGIEKNIVLPKILTKKLIEQFKAFKKNKSYKRTKIDIKLEFDFNKQVEAYVLPCLNKMISYLETIYLKKSRNTIGMCCLPNGKELYKSVVNNSLTLKNISIKNIHNYGLREVERIHKEMENIKKEYNFDGSLKDFSKYLKKLKVNKFLDEKDMLEYYKNHLKNINKKIIPKYFDNKVIAINCSVKPVPKYNEEFSSEAYYIPGDIMNRRKGTFYINMRNIKENNKMEGLSLTLHESNPGHHYQSTYVNENKKIPLFLKYSYSEAYSEGWALYVENFGDYETLDLLFGKYINEMLRAVRLVVDTGIHYYNWSYIKTFNYCKKYLFDTDFQIHNQLLRYISIPSQALCYKMGEKTIIDLLKKEQKKENFNIKKFHEKLLENGGIPLFLLKEKFN